MAVVHQKKLPLTGTVALMALLWSLLLVAPAHGVVVENLYQVTVPVEGEGDDQLAEAYRRGLEEVLVRVSGDRNVADREGIDELLEDAESLLQNWQEREGESGSEQLRLSFSRNGVNQALAGAGARVWGMNRPLTLAWIAVQDGGDRGLLAETGEASDQGWSALVNNSARERGLPLTLPPADRASDRRLLSEVWGQFMGQVSRASSGLDHDLLAVVRISRRDGGWQASWLYEGQGIEQSRTISADEPETLARDLVDAWASELASRYAASGGSIQGGPGVRLVVRGVESAADYAGVKQALVGLNPVESAGAVEVSRDRIVFRVEYTGEVEQLRQNIALDERFREQSEDEGSRGDDDDGSTDDFGTTAETLYYRWQQQVVTPSGAGDR